MCRKPIGHGLFLRCLLGDAGGDACVGIGLDFLLRMTGFVIPGGMQWSVGIFPLFSQCDPAGRRPAMCGRKRMIIIAHSAQLSPHCTGGGNGSDKGGNARSDRAKTAHILRDRSVTVFVRSRRRCPADTFGATFWCQKVVNLFLAGKTESKVRGYFPKNRSGNFSLLKILFLVLLARSKWGKCLLLHSAYSYLCLTP